MKYGCNIVLNVLIDVVYFLYCQRVYSHQFQHLFPFSITFVSSKINKTEVCTERVCQDYQTSLESRTNIWHGNVEASISILKDIPKRETQVEAVSLDSHIKKKLNLWQFWRFDA